MPDEPLIFIEVALLDEMAESMPPLLDTSAPIGQGAPTHAIFYSISNCQAGLAGISFGNALIKRVVGELSKEFRSLRTFATLSPIPGFHRWLSQYSPAIEQQDEPLGRLFTGRSWARDDALAATVREPLLELAAHYLLEAKRPNGRALDPVAHFHVSNGARVGRIQWLADPSTRGRRESAGMMVNYIYDLDRIDQRQRAYAADGHIEASAAVLALVQRHSAR